MDFTIPYSRGRWPRGVFLDHGGCGGCNSGRQKKALGLRFRPRPIRHSVHRFGQGVRVVPSGRRVCATLSGRVRNRCIIGSGSSNALSGHWTDSRAGRGRVRGVYPAGFSKNKLLCVDRRPGVTGLPWDRGHWAESARGQRTFVLARHQAQLLFPKTNFALF